MKKLFKIAAVSALTLMSVNAFAASQQAQDVKKFSEWEEVTRDKVNAATDAIVQAMGTNDVAKTEAAIAEFDKKSAEYLAELDALGIQSAEAVKNHQNQETKRIWDLAGKNGIKWAGIIENRGFAVHCPFFYS